MTTRVKVSSKYQISIPAAARRKFHINPGDFLLVDVRDGYVVLMPEPQEYSEHLKGLHRKVWEGVDPREYVRQERGAWEE